MTTTARVVALGGAVALACGALGCASPQPAADGAATAAAATTLHPRQVEAREAIAAGRLDDARDALASVPESDPLYAGALTDLAVLYESRGNADAALATAGKLLFLEPENAEDHYVMARAYYRHRDYPRAERHALRALEIAPRHAPARYTVALVRLAAGQLDRAIDAYIRAMDIAKEPARVEAALADLARLDRERPDFADVQYALAFFARSHGSRDRELVHLVRFVELQPDGPAADLARQRIEDLGGP